jgi:phytanoyl-CoA hydroxylase
LVQARCGAHQASGKADMGQKEKFLQDGYLLLEGFYSKQRVGSVLRNVEKKIDSKDEIIVVDELTTGKRMTLRQAKERNLSHHVKVNDLYLEMPEVRSLALNDKITPVLTDLLGHTPLLCNSLYFEKGSTQPKHIDSLYMTPVTVNHLIAIWVALEDAHDDSGPLEYYPGSHLITPMKFNDGTYHAANAEMDKWNAYITSEIDRLGLQKRSFAAKKGDVFIWHANLLHGGGQINNWQLTRKSFVFHYFSIEDGKYAVGEKVGEGDAFWLNRERHALPELAAPANNFSEAQYLGRYPDVRDAVEKGTFISGQHHYDMYGKSEGRIPN